MVAALESEPDPQLPCSPRSFAKAHLDRLRSESHALRAEVEELSQDFDNQNDEPESLKALRTQSVILSAEVHNLEKVFANGTGENYKQAIWDAVQHALRKRHVAELASIRAAASFSGRHCALDNIDSVCRKRASSRSSRKSSDNASSTETPTVSNSDDSDSHRSDDYQQRPPISNSDVSDSSRSDDYTLSVENSYVMEEPPKPMAVPPPKWAPSPSAYPFLDDVMPSPVCPNLGMPPKLSPLDQEGRRVSELEQLDSSAESGHYQSGITEASCLSMSIEDWFDPEFRQVRNQSSFENVPNMKANKYGEVQTAMEEDVQMALEVLGFRRAKEDEDGSASLLSDFWPLW